MSTKPMNCRAAWQHMTEISRTESVRNFVQTLDMSDYLVVTELFPEEILVAYSTFNMEKELDDEQMQFFLRGFRRDAHPMAVMCGVVGALSAFYHDSTDITNPEHREISAIRLIAKLPTLVAMSYKYGIGQPIMYPQNSLSYSGNFLRMMFGVPCE